MPRKLTGARRLGLPDDPPQAPIDPRATLWRTLQTFNATRIVIALVLVAFLSVSGLRGLVVENPAPYWQLCSVYLLGSIAFVVLTMFSRERFLLQLSTQIAVDVVIISSLYVVAGGTRSGLAILFLFPLAGGAILAPMILALLYTSAVTLLLLGESLLRSLQAGAETSISTAGLYGMAFFAAVLVLNQLASKLIKQEDLAARRGQALRLQEAINRLIIADMGDGILVVDRDTDVVIANPAAEFMLGMALPVDRTRFRLIDVVALAPIADAFFSWLRRPPEESAGDDLSSRFVVIKPGDNPPTLQGATTVWGGTRRDLAAHLKLRFARVEGAGQHEERTVIFLQDVTEIENKAQDLKLASMGRLTASIAHEVRNPLSAIAYAASLLEEEIPSPTQSRLLRIIDENVTRLNQMIVDIL
jgi:two-component system sensor histidine kinase PilS (NtrC family)